MNTPWWAALSSYSSSDVDLVCIPASHCRRKTCWMSERCCICCFQPRSRTEEAASLPPSPFFLREPAPNSTIWMWAKWSSALNPPHCCVGTNLHFRAGGRRRRGQRRARAARSARPLRARALRWQRCDVMFRARDARQMLVRSRAPTGSGTDAATVDGTADTLTSRGQPLKMRESSGNYPTWSYSACTELSGWRYFLM